MSTSNTTLTFLFIKNLTPAFFRILKVLWSYERQKHMSNYKTVFPSREKIAKQANCSVDRVKQFNQMVSKFGSSFITIKKRFNPKTKRYSSNVYEMDKELFKLITCLDGLGYLRKWETLKEELYIKISENEQFIYDKFRSYRQRITHGSPQKLPDNKDSLNQETKIKVPTEGSHSSLIFNFGLSAQTLHLAEYYCTKQAVIDARNDFEWFVKKGNKINSPDGLMRYLLKNQQIIHNKRNEKILNR